MIRQKMDSLSFELLSRMAHMMTRMTRMTHWLDSHDSLARWLTVCQDPFGVLHLAYSILKFLFSGFILEIIGLWDSVGADFKV